MTTIVNETGLKVGLRPVEERILEEIRARSWSCPLVSITSLRPLFSERTLMNSLCFLASQGAINLFSSDAPRCACTAEEWAGMLVLGGRRYNACSIRHA